jgi:phosphoribosylglycinamide formyltransferase 2
MVEGESAQVEFGALERVLAESDTQLRLFGKPEVGGHRRMGVALARAATVEAALEKAKRASAQITVTL